MSGEALDNYYVSVCFMWCNRWTFVVVCCRVLVGAKCIVLKRHVEWLWREASCRVVVTCGYRMVRGCLLSSGCGVKCVL